MCAYDRVTASPMELETRFNQDDLAILSTIGNIIASSLENALTFQQIETLARKNEQMVKNLSILNQINTAMMSRASYEELLRIILESITLKQGLGFHRAILLLVDEETNTLQAVKSSVQAADPEGGMGDPSEPDLSQLLISQGDRTTPEADVLDRALKTLKIPLHQDQGILAQTVLEGRQIPGGKCPERSPDPYP